jgi:hypothetical protein
MFTNFQHMMAVMLCATTAAAGCASTGATRSASASAGPQASVGRSVMAEYVQKLPPGTPVRVSRSHAHTVRGTLMKATDQSVFVQPKTRIAEPMVEIPLDDVLGVTPEHPGGKSIGRAIGAGAAAGAAATVTILLILLASVSD